MERHQRHSRRKERGSERIGVSISTTTYAGDRRAVSSLHRHVEALWVLGKPSQKGASRETFHVD